MDYLVRQDESGYGVEIRETAVRSVFEHLLPPGPGNLEKTTDFAARLARGSVFADNLASWLKTSAQNRRFRRCERLSRPVRAPLPRCSAQSRPFESNGASNRRAGNKR